MNAITERCSGCGGRSGHDKEGRLPHRTNDGRPLCRSCYGVRRGIGLDQGYADVHEPGALPSLMVGVDASGNAPSGAESWEYREPHMRRSLHRDQEILLGGAKHYQQSPPVHVGGTAPARPKSQGGVALQRMLAVGDLGRVYDRARLTDRERRAVEMRADDVSRADIATQMQCSPTAVKETLKRAKKKLRSAITEDELQVLR